MFILGQTSVKMAVLVHKQAKVSYSLSVTVHLRTCATEICVTVPALLLKVVLFTTRTFAVCVIQPNV